ncbi:hypothetical protein ACFQFH_02030 [Halobaculum halobium]|uniref:DUF7992 domain-containing protein n=1 Tax=Halobaculum halobium TaxID=3032281 RepID=A0ABD5TAJ4_9EURY|nr:hypothetical protein [Halobaculum sp. SYNS20]
MVLDVETPAQPDLTNRPIPSVVDVDEAVDSDSDLRREELEAALADGAWAEGFREWGEYTDLIEAEVQALADAEVFGELDFFWDPTEQRIRHELPAITDLDGIDPDLESRAAVELSELCQTVIETVEHGYLDWGSDGGADESWTAETFEGDGPPEP